MKGIPIFAVAAALAICLPAMGGSVIQPVDTTSPKDDWPSQKYIPDGDERVADDWTCTDGRPISTIKWWGAYHVPPGSPNPVGPPSHQPYWFVLKQYANSGGAPGTEIATATILPDYLTQTFVQSVERAPGQVVHIFSYTATLRTPWTQEKGGTYWLGVQAEFSHKPTYAADGFEHWAWLSTPHADSLGAGGRSRVGGAWDPIEFGTPPQPVDFAFEIGSALPVGTTANKTTFQQSDVITVTADVEATSAPCYPFVRIIQPDGSALYLEKSRGFVAGVAPYLGIEAGPIALPQISGYPVLQNAQFSNMPVGPYRLESGAVDPAATTDVNNLQYVGSVDNTPLLIE